MWHVYSRWRFANVARFGIPCCNSYPGSVDSSGQIVPPIVAYQSFKSMHGILCDFAMFKLEIPLPPLLSVEKLLQEISQMVSTFDTNLLLSIRP